jgi:CheY-like chemotaxis protein
MARVLALTPDLLFGSNVVGALRAGGHDVRLVGTAEAASDALADGFDVVVVDLTSPDLDGCAFVAAQDLAGARTLGFYSHVDAETKARAEAAGFDLVVPRSRMNREGTQLVAGMAAAGENH